ncbi:hypothetical protein A1Q2_04746 [Trichosporon asahii var. asahii CBS 8904]|uniref:DOPA 4,5-dioxygenase n=2 Tax=Trichosporon asahii var. asahii TaxID=189963 RepID=K1VVM4_TRIAC|nr:hypothetical protein A1Q1_00755 [Trichosporon asahii var. asahii CBS 2479]EJT52850.1 hypothetical protein A1Q1_00755 [Trichosporon asahii var. asahii CBS 2479]EKD00873.1 hypothetical protein A1Q2_04746 [Trichosporon asahii var. asahii CBS 8904]
MSLAAQEASALSAARSTGARYGEPRVTVPQTALSDDLVANPLGHGSSIHVNPPREGMSPAYGELYGGEGVWDVHIYWKPNNLDEKEYARKLHAAIRREFPELHVKRFWEVPIGPHPTPMFEVNMFNAAQLGAIFNYLVENRGPLSVLIHPNTGRTTGDHTTRATWLGPKIELDTDPLRKVDADNGVPPE